MSVDLYTLLDCDIVDKELTLQLHVVVCVTVPRVFSSKKQE